MSRIRADKISNKAGTGAVQLQYGAEVPVGYGITGAGTINVTGNIQSSSGFTGNVTGTAGGLTGTPDITVNNIVASAATFSGNVSVGGTLTYEDVTNVDSVGLITARNGINISDTTQASSTTTGALKVAGGVGIVKNLHVGGTITGDGDLHLKDNDKLRLGSSLGANTLDIYNSSSVGYIQQNGTDALGIYAQTLNLSDPVGGKYIVCNRDSDVEIYFDNAKKIETTNTGAVVTGILTATAFKLPDGSTVGGVAGINTVGLSTFRDVHVGGALTCTGTIVNKIDTTTERSVIIGEEASASNTNTDYCVIIGYKAGYQNASGKSGNTFVGTNAGAAYGGTQGSYNTMIGQSAGSFMYDTANYNVALGQGAGEYNSKSYCVSIGAGSGHSRGQFNTVIGGKANGAGNTMDTNYMTYPNSNSSTQWGENNICIGYQANTPNDNADNYIVIGNAKSTNFVVGQLGFEITAGITTNTGSLVVGAGVSAVGIVTASGGLSVGPGVLAEKLHVDSGSAATGTIDHDVLTHGMVWYSPSNATGTWIFNCRGSASVSFDTLLNAGETTTMTMYVGNNNAANYMTAFQIQGATQTVEWAGGTAPSAGTGSGYDVYTVTIIKTASNAYKCFGNFTNFN